MQSALKPGRLVVVACFLLTDAADNVRSFLAILGRQVWPGGLGLVAVVGRCCAVLWLWLLLLSWGCTWYCATICSLV
jgi:hypothetical protein